jgi:hypothetical protein
LLDVKPQESQMAKRSEPEKPAADRAAKLRKEIEDVASDSQTGGQNEQHPLSPRDFINKRMAELDKKKGT